MSRTPPIQGDSAGILGGTSPTAQRSIEDGIELNAIQQPVLASLPVTTESVTDQNSERETTSHQPSPPSDSLPISVSISPRTERSIPSATTALPNQLSVPLDSPETSIPLPKPTPETYTKASPEDIPPSELPSQIVNNNTPTTSSTESSVALRRRRRPTNSDSSFDASDYLASDYLKLITEAGKIFDHLENARMLADVQDRPININYIDYTVSSTSDMVRINDQKAISDLIQNVPAGVVQRLFIVEDLDWPTIDCLGTCLGINPEFFEEHLINSGYGRAQYDDAPATSWVTSGMKKSYTSLKWYRPAWRMPLPPFSKQDSEDLLDVDAGLCRLEYASGNSRKVRVFEAKVNIFRSEWELWTDPRTTPTTKRLCGWEERASVWSKTYTYPERNYKIVILLLDPLPILSEAIERVVPISTIQSEYFTDEEEQSRIYLPRTSIDLNLNIGDIEEQIPRRVQPRNRRPRLQAFQRLIQSYLLGENRIERPTEKKLELVESKSIIEQTTSRVSIDVDSDAVFQSPEQLGQLRNRLFNTQATVDNFGIHLDANNLAVDGSDDFGILRPLFEIVRRDIIEFLKRLNNVLEGINSEILDDITMENRLAIWRKLITRAQLELPELQRSLVNFFSFLGDQGTQSPQTASLLEVIKENREIHGALKDFKNLFEQIDTMLQRLNVVSSSLTSNMALLDSRRSIAEAQSVTKLTELAFFYIPLTFAATLFGMQIEEFENRAPLSIFIGLGVLFTAISYAVRLILRSTWLRLTTHSMKESIKLYADRRRQHIQTGNISSSLFLQWLLHMTRLWLIRFWSTTWIVMRASVGLFAAIFSFLFYPFKFIAYILLSISVICMIPLALLWTRHMEPGIQVPITLALLATSSAMVITVCWRAVDPEVRSTLPRLIKQEFVRFSRGGSKIMSFLVLMIFIGAFVVPLAVLWTKPISPGVKAAVTTAFVLIILISLIAYGIYSLVSLARGYRGDVYSESYESSGRSSFESERQ